MLLLVLRHLSSFDDVALHRMVPRFHLSYEVNPFQANVLLLYPLKTSENLWFSDDFRGYRKGILA